MKIEINLDTESIKANNKVSASNAGLAVVQTVVVGKLLREKLQTEQNRVVKQYGLNEGLTVGKNASGKGSLWAKARAQLSRAIKAQAEGKGVGFSDDKSADRAANRALNAAGFISRESKVQKDWDKAVVEMAMNKCATRDKDNKITDVDFDEVVAYLGGEESDAGKAAITYFDELAEKRFGLELETA